MTDPGTAPEPLRVLFAITRGEVGGAQEHVRILIRGLLAEGHEVGVVAGEGSFLTDDVARAGAKAYEWPSIARDIAPLADLRARRELRGVVREFRPDVLHLHSSKAGLVGRLLVKRPAVTVFTVHHAAFGAGRRWTHRVLARPVEQVALRLVDGIISVGARDVPTIRKLARQVPVTVVPNAVPSDQAAASPQTPVRAALWVARMKHPKDPLQAVDAWERVVERHFDARLTMCGDGPLADRLRDRIARSAARANIDYVGAVPDLRPYQERSSLYVLATDVEGGTTMATLEAMSQGLVPVLNDAGDAWLLEHERCGVVVPRRSPRTLAAAIIELFDRPDRILAMRERAIWFARERWTVADGVRATVGFYEEIRRRG